MNTQRRFMLILTAKNEAPGLLEWVAYHRVIGFTDIVVYQNDSTDGTQKLLRTMEKAGFIQYFRNHDRQGAWQNKAYRRASRLPEFASAEWAMALDADEFLVVHARDGRVSDLVDALPPEANCATIHWKCFGSSYHREMPDDLVTESFTLAEAPERISYRMAGFKSLFKTDTFHRIGIHKPKNLRPSATEVYCNGSGILLDPSQPPGWRSKDPGMRRLAQVNHYALRDLQRFLVKSARGRTANHERSVDLKYWSDFDVNDVEDRYAAQKAADTRAEMARMDAATRGRLSLLTREAREATIAEFMNLLEQPYYREIYDSIISTFPTTQRRRATR